MFRNRVVYYIFTFGMCILEQTFVFLQKFTGIDTGGGFMRL